jgi:DNA-binding transcriptional ArsR family regulator
MQGTVQKMSLIELFSALADPTRSRVVEMLHLKSRPVHELAAAFDISRPAISRHLRVLKDAGLVKEEKSGRENVYSLQRGKLKPMLDWLKKHRVAKAGKAKAAAPVVEAPAPVAEVVPEAVLVSSVAAVPEVAPVAVVEAAPQLVVAVSEEPVVARKRTPKPKAARPVEAPLAAAPSAAPQLSFFDL